MKLDVPETDCARCGHEYLDHAPNWMVVPALSPCTECDCPEFVTALIDGSMCGLDPHTTPNP